MHSGSIIRGIRAQDIWKANSYYKLGFEVKKKEFHVIEKCELEATNEANCFSWVRRCAQKIWRSDVASSDIYAHSGTPNNLAISAPQFIIRTSI